VSDEDFENADEHGASTGGSIGVRCFTLRLEISERGQIFNQSLHGKRRAGIILAEKNEK
jgi:hypothetical protein